MKTINSFLLQDSLCRVGLLLIAASSVTLAFIRNLDHRTSSGAFFINYIMSAGYLLAVFIRTVSDHGRHWSKGRIEHTILLLVLWYISAYALNRDVNVFDSSVPWLCVWIVVSSIALLFAMLHYLLPKFIRYLVFFCLGTALVLFIYYSIYLLPLYLISVLGIIAIGISLHTYIPLCLTIVSILMIIRAYRNDKAVLYPVIAGVILPIAVCVVFLISWNNTNKQINLILNQNALNEAKLPAWVAVSQEIPKNAFAERILKTGLVYTEAKTGGNFFFGGMPSKSFDEPKQHDPLVVMATLFFDKPNLDETERVKILKSMYNSRHQAHERLWDGDKLQTASVISNVKIWPDYRMAYTEKMLTIKNTDQRSWGQQEAIYTFHLPESSVVSSLCLWINGKEEKSRLTTKATADSAYKQIVGVEQHDPSVIHWQEGNTVSVRVFPCTTKENRRFKIGITSPLRAEGNRLIYDNIFFEGPEASGALETLQLTFSDKPDGLVIPADFKQHTIGVYRADHSYNPDWQISCKAPALASTAFAFGGAGYQLKPYVPQYESFTPQAVYLDVNKAWMKADLLMVWDKVKATPVYVYDDKLVRLTEKNLDEVYESLSRKNFSLFPVNAMQHPEQALLISKSDGQAPGLSDLDDSDFAGELTAYLKTTKHIRFFNIGHELTPYLKALKELRVLNYTRGTATELYTMLDKHQFVKDQENEATVVIGDAGMMIQKAQGADTTNAPDHLLRLFAYNDIMKKVGPNYFAKNYVQPDVIAEAQQAYIVSPVSSMIVLETVKDYERFGIDESKDSLKNASMKSSGAVPEPHEWMLIVLSIGIGAYLIAKPKVADNEY